MADDEERTASAAKTKVTTIAVPKETAERLDEIADRLNLASQSEVLREVAERIATDGLPPGNWAPPLRMKISYLVDANVLARVAKVVREHNKEMPSTESVAGLRSRQRKATRADATTSSVLSAILTALASGDRDALKWLAGDPQGRGARRRR